MSVRRSVRPSVGPSVRPSVRGDRVGKCKNAHFRPCPPVRNWNWPCIRPCFSLSCNQHCSIDLLKSFNSFFKKSFYDNFKPFHEIKHARDINLRRSQTNKTDSRNVKFKVRRAKSIKRKPTVGTIGLPAAR